MTQLIVTADGSHTLFAPIRRALPLCHGAIARSEHVFLNAGFAHLPKHLSLVRILEMGFGTGLNAFLTCFLAAKEPRTNRLLYRHRSLPNCYGASLVPQLCRNNWVCPTNNRYLKPCTAPRLTSEYLYSPIFACTNK